LRVTSKRSGVASAPKLCLLRSPQDGQVTHLGRLREPLVERPGPPGHLHTQVGCLTPFVCPTAPGGIFWSPLRSGQPSSWLQRRNFPANPGTDKYHYAEHAFRQAAPFALCELVAKNKGYPFDLTDAQWELIEPLVPTPARRVAVRRCICSAGSWVGTVKCLLGAQIDA
jgi:hypothetical protein